MTYQVPYVSVVIPTYNEIDRLSACLKSLAEQDYPAERAEIIVVDDGSPEPVPAQTASLSDPIRCKILHHTCNLGRSRARNSALSCANGDLIIFLDSDMTADAHFLSLHVRTHENSVNRVIIGNIRYAPNLGSSALMRYMEGRGVHRCGTGEQVPFNFFVTGNSSVRRDLLLATGFFDPHFRSYGGEDLELGYRMEQYGASFFYQPDALTLHHHNRTLDELCLLMYTYGKNSIPYLLRKHPALAGLLRVDFCYKRWTPRSLLMRALLVRPLYWSIRKSGCLLDPWCLPDIVLHYLVWASRTRGFLGSGPEDR